MIIKRIFIVCFLSVFESFFGQNTIANVKNYGAIGNDNKDDTAAFQKCIDELAKKQGGTMIIPKGTYYISHLKFFGKKYSNISISGNGSTIKQVFPKQRIVVHGGLWRTFAERYSADGCFVFDAQISNQKNDALSIKNILIKDLNFESDVLKYGFDELSHQISAHGVSNFRVENCNFTGFLGDGIAICAGTDLNVYSYAYNKDITIKNCNFNGINKDNRQGISIYYADGFLIDSCNFKNTTRDDMPGAIDIEPNEDTQVSRDGIISNCTFENIGGNAAVVVHTRLPNKENEFSNKNFVIKDSKFNNVRVPFSVVGNDQVISLQTENYDVIFENCEVSNAKGIAHIKLGYNILFKNITFKNIYNSKLESITEGGGAHVTFERCNFENIQNENGIAFHYTTRNINFIGCSFKSFKKNAITFTDIDGPGKIIDNQFISTESPNSLPLVIPNYNNTRRVNSSTFKNNTFKNNFKNINIKYFLK